jgi:hypothetical protein
LGGGRTHFVEVCGLPITTFPQIVEVVCNVMLV